MLQVSIPLNSSADWQTDWQVGIRNLWVMGVCCLGFSAAAISADPKPFYENDFQKAVLHQIPDEFLVLDGLFTVEQEGDNKFLELPGAPLDNFGLLLGPTQSDGVCVTARIFATKQGRRTPTFGVSLSGAAGVRLQVTPAKKTIEIFAGDESAIRADFEWESGHWTHLKLQTRKSETGHWQVEGKAWTEGTPEPADWMIRWEEKQKSSPGRAGIWGSPISGTPIRFDDLRILPAH